MRKIEIKLALPKELWSELANTLESKIRLIERGDYGDGENPGDNERWIADLNRVLEHVVERMQKKGISW